MLKQIRKANFFFVYRPTLHEHSEACSFSKKKAKTVSSWARLLKIERKGCLEKYTMNDKKGK